MQHNRPYSRRSLLRWSGAWGAALMTTPGLFAEELIRTPEMTEGPFYPDHLPLDTDNDLLILNDSINPAVGKITHLSGRILDAGGNPVRNAFIEIWQVDNSGVYLHSADNRVRDRKDPNFQGYGRFLTGTTGEYYFRTIKPVPYPGRTPHIHVAVSRNGRRISTTQLFINGHPQNATDGILNSISDPLARETVLVDFEPVKESRIGELRARFDIVMGVTPEESEDGKLHGGIGAPERNRSRDRR